ncbi:Putative response regulator/phosphatase RpfG-like [Vibrio harveyi]|uniref:response regulator n=1 Tax=Vibrio harveyi TaxID=669 RepID=UPI002AD877F8|nr:two-component system response regulator [Vibrio harveyi]CAK6715935.1 Putative response regulator/phosphatase RpfG-like [Vibrio harveyi]
MEESKPLVLIIDDTPQHIQIISNVLSDNYQVKAATNGNKGIEIALQEPRPEVILLDIVMPEVNGFEVCKKLKKNPLTRAIPIIFLTAQSNHENEQYGFDLGAVDYITKPISPAIVKVRVRAQIMAYNQSRMLAQQVKEKTVLLEQNQLEIINCLARAGEFKDNETGMHVIRMSHYSRILAEELGAESQWCDLLFSAAPMHDIGKIGTPDAILLKPGKLDEQEWQEMKRHVDYGFEILGKHDSPLLNLAREIVLYHHEKWDGSGYPNGLSGEAIPLSARIVAIADVFDALTSERPYKRAWSIDETCDLLQKEAGHHFDPKLVSVFISIVPRLQQIMVHYRDDPTKHKDLSQ